MSSYRLITSGKNQRREYFSLNHSPLFQVLPDQDFAQEQRKSYHNFLYEKLPKLLNFYFPKERAVELSDYNNKVKINIEGIEIQEPKIEKKVKGKKVEVEFSEEEAQNSSLTWNHLVSFV
jgi:DNA-directed RNA polymerase beta subunit